MKDRICNICGSNLILKGGRYICSSCGAYDLQSMSDEELVLETFAYQKLRLGNFDEALSLFKDIVGKYTESGYAYWGLVLSTYGIKYEFDYNGQSLPTCYNTRYESFLDDVNYKKALKYSDSKECEYYIKQARLIENIRKEWVEKASKEEPFDIFISFKETEMDSVNKTQDYNDCYSLFNYLTKEGYHVFFAPESLKKKTGEKYEPYIFNALNTAKIMILYSSKPEYINATWVKNEWMRFAKNNKKKSKKDNFLILAYKNFNPSKLGAPLNETQALDANKLTFVNELEDILKMKFNESKKDILYKSSVKKSAINYEKEAKKSKKILKQSVQEGTIILRKDLGEKPEKEMSEKESKLLKIANLLLSKHEFTLAKDRYVSILRINPDNYEAMMNRILAESCCTNFGEWGSIGAFRLADETVVLSAIHLLPRSKREELIAYLFSFICSCSQKNDFDIIFRYIRSLKEIDFLDYELQFANVIKVYAEQLKGQNIKQYLEVFNVCLPLIQSRMDLYNNSISVIVQNLMKKKQKVYAEEYLELINIDERSLGTYNLLKLQIKVGVFSIPKMLSLVDTDKEFKDIEKVISTMEDSNCNDFLDLCYANCIVLVSKNNMQLASRWIRTICQYDYSNRSKMMDELFRAFTINGSNKSTLAFNDFVAFVDLSEKSNMENFIFYTSSLINHHCFKEAEVYLLRFNKLFPKNKDITLNLLYCSADVCRDSEMVSVLGRIRNFDYFNLYFGACNNSGDVRASIKEMVDSCVLYVEESLAKNSNAVIFESFEKIISFYPKEFMNEMEKIIFDFASVCHKRKYFDKAIQYYEKILKMKNNLSYIYWNVFKAKNKIYYDSEVHKLKKKAFDCVEFENAIALETDEKQLRYYLSLKG